MSAAQVNCRLLNMLRNTTWCGIPKVVNYAIYAIIPYCAISFLSNSRRLANQTLLSVPRTRPRHVKQCSVNCAIKSVPFCRKRDVCKSGASCYVMRLTTEKSLLETNFFLLSSALTRSTRVTDAMMVLYCLCAQKKLCKTVRYPASNKLISKTFTVSR